MHNIPTRKRFEIRHRPVYIPPGTTHPNRLLLIGHVACKSNITTIIDNNKV